MLTCTGEIVKFKSGKHVKTSSIATDEHVKEIFLQQQLREMKVEDWTQEALTHPEPTSGFRYSYRFR
jgi:predicted ATP-dependent protease